MLDEILPQFERDADATVQVLAVGTGQALALGERGHDKEREEKFVADGSGSIRLDLMYNNFVILGPAEDPAGILGEPSVVDAFTKIAANLPLTGGSFISRGDQSGTHSRELGIWEAAGITPEGDWYRSTGQGMGSTLTVADEFQAYTLSDRGTYLARKDRLDLQILVEGDDLLFNPYGVIAVNPARHPDINVDLVAELIEYITSVEVQERIAAFGADQFGQPLFFPNSEAWKANQKSEKATR